MKINKEDAGKVLDDDQVLDEDNVLYEDNRRLQALKNSVLL